MSMNFSASFDPASLKQIAALAGLNILLTPEVQAAMSQGGDLFIAGMQAEMAAKFKNPTGTLAGSLQKIITSPFEIQVGSPLPYAWRRDQGFSGMTDRLGRYYPHDPGIAYVSGAEQTQSQAILRLLDAAVSTVLGGL